MKVYNHFNKILYIHTHVYTINSNIIIENLSNFNRDIGALYG